jgi:hypothetical protein
MIARDHVQRARKLLASSDAFAVSYAALELRMAIEAITYDKLRVYAPRLPAAVLEKWQPPQAMKALLQFEPWAASNSRLRFAEQRGETGELGPWIDLGEHRSFGVTWLRKAYNSLGSMLHAPSPRQSQSGRTEQQRRGEWRAGVESILEEVARVSESQMTSTLAQIVQFDCAACGALVLCNEEGARASGTAVCLAPSCAAEHRVQLESNGEVLVTLIATEFECIRCKVPTAVENRRVELGTTFTCSGCSEVHEFVSKEWGYALQSELRAAENSQ